MSSKPMILLKVLRLSVPYSKKMFYVLKEKNLSITYKYNCPVTLFLMILHLLQLQKIKLPATSIYYLYVLYINFYTTYRIPNYYLSWPCCILSVRELKSVFNCGVSTPLILII
jgi:hypothetical protein